MSVDDIAHFSSALNNCLSNMQRSPSTDSTDSNYSFLSYSDSNSDRSSLMIEAKDAPLVVSSTSSSTFCASVDVHCNFTSANTPVTHSNPATTRRDAPSHSEPAEPSSEIVSRFTYAKSRTWTDAAITEDTADSDLFSDEMIATYPPTHSRFGTGANDPTPATRALELAHSPTVSSGTHSPYSLLPSSPAEDRFLFDFGSPCSSTHDSPRSAVDKDTIHPQGHEPSPWASDSPCPSLACTPPSSVGPIPPRTSDLTSNPNFPNSSFRPASVGPAKLHRRQKSAKRVPPPPFSSELLKAARQKALEQSSQSACVATSSENPSSPSSKLFTHSPVSSASSNASSTSNSTFIPISSSPFSTSSTASPVVDSNYPTPSSSLDTPELPLEVWTQIFANLSPTTLLEVQYVCSDWHSVCWNTVRYLDMTGKCERLVDGQTWISLFRKMPNLKVLSLSSKIATDEILALLPKVVPWVESLFIHCHTESTSAAGLKQIARLSKLQKLALWMPVQIPASALRSLLPHLTSLTHFKAETLRETFCERAFTSLDLLVNLRVLDLSWCKKLSLAVFARIAKLTNLETLILDMCGCDVSMGGLSHLKDLPKLAEISLKWCDHLTDAMLPTLASFQALARLDVSFCRHLTAGAITRWLPHINVCITMPNPQNY